MAEEIQEAVQIIRVGYDGIEIAMKVCGGTIGGMKQALDFLTAVMDYEKTMGKTDMRRLLMKGGDLQVFQFPTGDTKKVKKMAKKYGILYSVLPGIHKKDGMSEIVFHSEAVPRANMMIQKLKSGRIATLDDYLKNGDQKEMDKALSFLKGRKKEDSSLCAGDAAWAGGTLEEMVEKAGSYAVGKQSVRMEEIKGNFGLENEQAEKVVGELLRTGVLSKEEDGQYKALMDKEEFSGRMKGYRELAQRVQAAAAAQNPDYVDITIAKKLIAEENEHAVKTRIPGTWGENARYIWINKDQAMEIHEGRTILAFLNCNKDYKIYSEDNRAIGTMKGKDLYDMHYDPVSAQVRKRYADVERKAKGQGKTQKKKPAPKPAPPKR